MNPKTEKLQQAKDPNASIKLLVTMFLALFLISCAGSRVRLPIKTSLGNLVSIEKKDSVTTDERTISAEAGKVLYLLSFEGKSEITYEGAEREALQTLTISDSKGTEFAPVYSGSPTNTGTLSGKDWRYNGALKPQNGKFVFAGVLSVPSGKIALVYSVPRDASDLSLKDGKEKHPID